MNGFVKVEEHDGVSIAELAGDVDISRAASVKAELLRATPARSEVA